MNARYYLPEVGRFVSADTIVPEAEEPQSYNRYAYAQNDPVNFIDPTGHCIKNYEAGSADMDTCVAGWNAVVNYLTGAAYCPGCSGNFPNELVNDWLLNADIGTLENLMEVMGIDYGYTWTPPQGYATSSGAMSLRSPEARAGVCQYWQSCFEPLLTMEEIPPDALILGVSVSGAGVAYGVLGGEAVFNFRANEFSLFAYRGEGAGIALEADKSYYGGLVWNLEHNYEYEGISPTLAVDMGAGVHGQASVFWEEGTMPFTGDTWGVAVGPGAGVGVGITGSYGDYTCIAFCR